MPLLYLLAALVGSIIPVNRAWVEPADGVTIYLADNGIHSDIVMPVRVGGLDWGKVVARNGFAVPVRSSEWIAFGAGEEHVYLDTPRWRDIRLSTIWSALTGGRRVMHVEYVRDPAYAAREIRLRPEEYRRLWASIRSDMILNRTGEAQQISHQGYGCCDRFFRTGGKASALRTCNNWVADRLRLAGVKTSLWPPFTQGLVWRYRRAIR